MHTIKIGDSETKIETRQLTLLFSGGDLTLPIEHPNAIRLWSEATIYHADRVHVLHVETAALTRQVFAKSELDFVFEKRQQMNVGVRHVLGLIDMTLKFHDLGRTVVWVHPETHLHPSTQTELADVALQISERIK